mmetsp:Transcript_32150/g.48489  ORF Transcript_32150/g.48489 Transcript_32150/m.48489 type:complete len:127 (-) Transcript_32150:98-478(-)
MMWSLIAYGIAPTGLAVWILVMSGLRPCQRIAKGVLNLHIAVGPLQITLPMLLALFSLIVWAIESPKVFGTVASSGFATTADHDYKNAQKWRSERNWWILNFNLLIWITNWRVNGLLTTKDVEKKA